LDLPSGESFEKIRKIQSHTSNWHLASRAF
jgi:hypothetical protein